MRNDIKWPSCILNALGHAIFSPYATPYSLVFLLSLLLTEDYRPWRRHGVSVATTLSPLPPLGSVPTDGEGLISFLLARFRLLVRLLLVPVSFPLLKHFKLYFCSPNHLRLLLFFLPFGLSSEDVSVIVYVGKKHCRIKLGLIYQLNRGGKNQPTCSSGRKQPHEWCAICCKLVSIFYWTVHW